MKYPNHELLVELCQKAHDNPKFAPRNGLTYCNQAVHYILYELTGYKKFKGKLANKIVSTMVEDKETWIQINMEAAQGYANKGYAVVAGKKKKVHGHVVFVYPGKEVYSGKWATKVPRCVSIGKKNFINKGVNFAFSRIPQFYVFMPFTN